ncbi:MAG: signal peptidase I [bacterium]
MDLTPQDNSEETGQADSSSSAGGTTSRAKLVFGFLGELLHVIVISLAIILPIRYFLIQPFYVKGASMEPNFYDHEYLIIDEISYRFHEPQRGDIVVFRYPNDPSQFFIKRIVAIPGERIVVSGGVVRIISHDHPDGFLLDESDYIGHTYTSGDKDVTLTADEYYLLGDNRAASMDSRSFGPVHGDLIVGRAVLRGWPPDRMGIFTGVVYNEVTVVEESSE